MKPCTVVSVFVILTLSIFSCAKQDAVMKKEIKTDVEKFSYAIGLEIGVSLEQLKDEIELQSVFQGIKDTLSKAGNKISEEDAKAIKNTVFQKVNEKMMAEQKVKGEESKKASETFLAENKTKEGVVTTESGLQYIVLKEGTGPKALATDKVKVHYVGTLLDGKEFDSSYKRNQPAEFPVNGVIKGWTEALQLMNVGSKYKLFIPSDLAYGERGAGDQIPPNATLVFEVELLEIVK